jgi:hypothetical protein
MAALTITKTYSDTQVLFEADLDGIKSSLETFVNTTKLNDDNIQDQGITGTDKIAATSVTAAKIAPDTITSSNIAASAVTTAKIAASNITTAKIDTTAVTAAKIAANGVPRPALPAVNIVTSSPSVTSVDINSIATPSSPYSGLTVSFTPVETNSVVVISLLGDAIYYLNSTSDNSMSRDLFSVALYQNGTAIQVLGLVDSWGATNDTGLARLIAFTGPVCSFIIPSGLTAGTSYTFGLNLFVNSTFGGAYGKFNDAKIRVMELV